MKRFLKDNEVYFTFFNTVIIAIIVCAISASSYFQSRNQTKILTQQTEIMQLQARISERQLIYANFDRQPRIRRIEIIDNELSAIVENVFGSIDKILSYHFISFSLRDNDTGLAFCTIPYINLSESNSRVSRTSDGWNADIDWPASLYEASVSLSEYSSNYEGIEFSPIGYFSILEVVYFSEDGLNNSVFFRVDRNGNIHPDSYADEILAASWEEWDHPIGEDEIGFIRRGYSSRPAVPYLTGPSLSSEEARAIVGFGRCMNLLGEIDALTLTAEGEK